jgi:hypothetical protein
MYNININMPSLKTEHRVMIVLALLFLAVVFLCGGNNTNMCKSGNCGMGCSMGCGKKSELFTKDSDARLAEFNFGSLTSPDSDWTKGEGVSNPAEYVAVIIGDLGVPTLFDGNSGGKAIWDEDTLKQNGKCWSRVELHDEMVKHDDHFDFLYTWFKMDIPADKLDFVKSLGSNILYDPLGKLLQVRCNYIGANIAYTYFVLCVVLGKMTKEKATELYKTVTLYTTPSSKLYDPNSKNVMESEMCAYRQMTNKVGQPQVRCDDAMRL